MRISVIGCGYLGATHAAGMASLGHEVVGVDVDAEKVASLASGRVPFHEPGLDELLGEQVASGRLRFTTDFAEAAESAVHFIGVGTPQAADGLAADLRYVHAAIDALIPHLRPGSLVVGKSTVPVGTARELLERIRTAQPEASLVWNPEFLREGFAIDDTLTPDRVVYGVRGASGAADEAERAAGARDGEVLDEVYARILAAGTPRLIVDYETSELVKVSANAFLATKISFINAMAEICEATGADVTKLADAIGLDERIGRKFLGAGLGFGGGCLPKDIRAFMARAEELGTGRSLDFLADVDAVNLRRRARVVELAREALGGDLRGRRVALLGLAFKPNSDDIRDSPALDVARLLLADGAEVVAFDPKAMPNARRRVPGLTTAESVLDAARGAEVVIVATEWRAFRDLDPSGELADAVAARRLIDGRNCLDPAVWREAGWDVRSLGRP